MSKVPGSREQEPAVPAVEIYSVKRKAAFLLENAVDSEDYERARRQVRKLGLDPDEVPHRAAARRVETDQVKLG